MNSLFGGTVLTGIIEGDVIKHLLLLFGYQAMRFFLKGRKDAAYLLCLFMIAIGILFPLSALGQSGPTLHVVVGTGEPGFSGDGGPARQAKIANPSDTVLDNRGALFFVDNGSRIRKVDSNGIITTVVGTGDAGQPIDGQGALSTSFQTISGLDVDSQGNLYLADAGNHSVYKVSATGTITRIAGEGTAGFGGDGGPAVSALLSSPQGLIIDTFGNLFIADKGNQRIREISPDGLIQTLAGGGTIPLNSEGAILGTSAQLGDVSDVSVDELGHVFFVDTLNKNGLSTSFLRKVVSGDYLSNVVGRTNYLNQQQPESKATGYTLSLPTEIATDPSGNFYFAEQGARRIAGVGPAGILTTVAGLGLRDYGIPPEENAPAKEVQLLNLRSVALDASGRPYFSNGHQIYTLNGPAPLRNTLPPQFKGLNVQPVFSSNPPAVTLNTFRDTPSDFTINAEDPEGYSVSYALVVPPAHGILTGTGPSFSYSPASGYVGLDHLILRMDDNESGNSVVLITFVIQENVTRFRPFPGAVVVGPEMQWNMVFDSIYKGITFRKPSLSELQFKLDGPGTGTYHYQAPSVITEPATAQLTTTFTVPFFSETTVTPITLLPYSEKPFRDDFDASLQQGWGFIDLDKSSAPDFQTVPGMLTLTAPPQPEGYPPPDPVFTRLVRPVTGDFVAETFVKPDAFSTRDAAHAGLLLWIDTFAYLRLGINSKNEAIFQFRDNFFPESSEGSITLPINAAESGIYLQLIRKGVWVKGSYSLDGQTWQPIVEKSFAGVYEATNAPVPGVLIGVYAIDTEQPGAQPFQSNFKDFRLTDIPTVEKTTSYFDALPVEVYRGAEVPVPIFLNKDATTWGGVLTFTAKGADGAQAIVTRVEPMEGMRQGDYRYGIGAKADFTLGWWWRPGLMPLVIVYVKIPLTQAVPSGVYPISLMVSGELRTADFSHMTYPTLTVQGDLMPITVINRRFGDLNSDDQVNAGDAVLALRIAVGLVQPTPEQAYYGDVAPNASPVPNGTLDPMLKQAGDGRIAVADATKILQKAVGLNPEGWPEP